MVFDFNFSSFQDVRQLRQLIDFIHTYDLGYPNYHSWVERAEAELSSGYKNAIIASSNGKIAGNLIFQPHKEIPSMVEIKNFRVDHRVRGRNFATFMFRQLEIESAGRYHGLISDVRQEQRDMANLFYKVGFKPAFNLPLYDNHDTDIVVVKFIGQVDSSVIGSLNKRVEKSYLAKTSQN